VRVVDVDAVYRSGGVRAPDGAWRPGDPGVRSGGTERVERALGDEVLGDLHGVERRALADLVARHEQRHGAVQAGVGADAADQHVVAPRGVEGRDGEKVFRGFDLFVCGDQIRKGAALNAVQIAELL